MYTGYTQTHRLIVPIEAYNTELVSSVLLHVEFVPSQVSIPSSLNLEIYWYRLKSNFAF